MPEETSQKRTGGSARFDILYREHYRSIHSYCRRRTHPSRVDDAVADVFAIAWRRIDDVPEGKATRPWLYGVAYKVIANQIRSERRRAVFLRRLEHHPQELSDGTQLQVVKKAEYELVLRALQRLQPIDRELLRLSVWEELPQAHIALALNLTEGAVKQRLHRARKKLAREYERLNPSDQSPRLLRRGGGQ